jgi:BirA family biotin operon repressor/biotin-[acetyl-CoA-carboxylase] ligase
MRLCCKVAWQGMPAKDKIDAAEVNRALAASPSSSLTAPARTRFAGYVQHFASIDSTNRAALEAAQQGARCGVWVADEQTAGRGRGGHAWHSSPGDGLYVSALVTPDLPAQQSIYLALAAGLAAQQAIDESCGLRVDLRWPNDLMLGGRKCGGILVETAAEASPEPSSSKPAAPLRYAVIGIGINVNHTEFPVELQHLATSLRLQSAGSSADKLDAQRSLPSERSHPFARSLPSERSLPFVRQPLLIHLLRELDNQIASLEDEVRGVSTGSNLLTRFAAASTWVRGKRVHVPEQGGYTGTTAGLDGRGFLLVDADDGFQRTVLSGGVREL